MIEMFDKSEHIPFRIAERIEPSAPLMSCAAVLEHAGFAIDAKESTRRAVKFRGVALSASISFLFMPLPLCLACPSLRGRTSTSREEQRRQGHGWQLSDHARPGRGAASLAACRSQAARRRHRPAQ
ncbi:hypothetical protein AB7M37_000489 [Sinorhizobium fredii]